MRKATKGLMQEMSLYLNAGNGLMTRYGIGVEDFLNIEREVGLLEYIKENKKEMQGIELDGMLEELESYIEYKGVYLGEIEEEEREAEIYKHVMHLKAIHKAYEGRKKGETKESVYKRYIRSEEYKTIEAITLEQVKRVQGLYDEIEGSIKEENEKEREMKLKIGEIGSELFGIEGSGNEYVERDSLNREIGLVVIAGEYMMSRWGKTPEGYKEIDGVYGVISTLRGYRDVVGDVDPAIAVEMMEEYIKEQGGDIRVKRGLDEIEEDINTNLILLMIYGISRGIEGGCDIEETYLKVIGGDEYKEMKENKSKRSKGINKKVTEIIKESIKEEK